MVGVEAGPAIRTSSSGSVPGGPPQAKNTTSVGSVTLRRIGSQRAYFFGSGLIVRCAAQSYRRGPFEPGPQLSRYQAPAGTPASSAFARTWRPPDQSAKSLRTPTT